jgi:hypothetical protein
MAEETKNDPTDRGTKRPIVASLLKEGTGLIPMDLPDFGYEIRLPEDASADDPISLFTLYYTLEIIETIVRYTNQCPREVKDPSKPYSRDKWYLTSVGEIYVYVALRISTTFNVQNEIADYWNKSTFSSYHQISKEMARDRFQELHMRFRVHGSREKGVYEKVAQNPP